jgi:hypothetical protein
MVKIFKEHAAFIERYFTHNLKLQYRNHGKLLRYLMSNHKAIQKGVKVKSGRKYKLFKTSQKLTLVLITDGTDANQFRIFESSLWPYMHSV